MKVDHPILINHARASAPAGGRFSRLDPMSEGRAQLFQVPLDRNVQAQLAMAELERLRTLEGDADWSRFAVLARTHATLEPIRAYCERKRIRYRTGDAGGAAGGLVTKTREGRFVIAALRRHPMRLVRTPALSRWLSRLARMGAPNNWLAELLDSARDLEAAVGGTAIPRAEAVDWIFESAGAYAREAPGHLNLLTAHGAKGREFTHLLVMDGGDWQSAAPDERRLLYVAMTRAKETLTMFQAQPRPMLDELSDCESVWRVKPRVLPMPMPELDRLHRELTLRDVDLGSAGRSPKSAAIHRTISQIRVGDPLLLENRAPRNSTGLTVGHLAKSCQLPAGRVVSAHVSAIVSRTKAQTPQQYQSSLRSDEWEVVLAEIVLSPTI